MTITCDAIKIAYRQSKDGHVVNFVLHPNEVPRELSNAPIGSQWQLQLVPLDDDGNPDNAGEDPGPSTLAAEIVDELLQLTDGSNWPEITGAEYKGYQAAMEKVHQVASDFQDRAYASRSGEPAPEKAASDHPQKGPTPFQADEPQPKPRPVITDKPSSDGVHRKPSWHEMSPAQQAGILCDDLAFQTYLRQRMGSLFSELRGADFAVAVTRHLCGVSSRKDIAPGTQAGDRWRGLVSDYRAFMRAPEVVG